MRTTPALNAAAVKRKKSTPSSRCLENKKSYRPSSQTSHSVQRRSSRSVSIGLGKKILTHTPDFFTGAQGDRRKRRRLWSAPRRAAQAPHSGEHAQ